MLTTLLLIAGFLLAVMASGLFSGAEMGIYSLNKLRLRMRSDRGERPARRLQPAMEHYEGLVSSTLIGTNIADYVASATITALFLGYVGPGSAEFYATAIVTPALLVFGNIVPKERFRRHTDQLMYGNSLVLTAWNTLCRWTGFPWLLSRLSRVLLRLVDPLAADAQRPALPRARMLRMLREGLERGDLTPFQRDTFERVMGLSRTRVARVMVPRQRAAMIPDTISREDFLRIARMAHFSRLPVYRRSPRRVIGVVSVFDVLTDPDQRPISEFTRDILELRITDSVPTAMRRLQGAHEMIAVVCDQRGECVGLLTMKDLVEEIVGELDVW